MIANHEDIAGMRAAGALAANLLSFLGSHVRPGVSTADLDGLAANWTAKNGAVSAPLGYQPRGVTPFPGHICTSVNEMVCHGKPSANQVLKDGDIINIDVTPILNGYHGDTSRTFAVGECSKDSLDLIDATEECLRVGIAAIRDGERLGTIGYLINERAEQMGFSIIKEFVGHGIGKRFHTQPYVLHHGIIDTGIKLKSGMKKPAWTLAEKKQQLLVKKLSEIEQSIPKFLKTELKESTLTSVSEMM
jgi:methionyl aminopeptidase